jgi:hypothetical protein
MYKNLVILFFSFFLISCNQGNIENDINLIESWNENKYTNMDIVSIPLWTNLEKLKWINKFNGESLTIEVNIDDFWSELLNKLKWAKWKTLHIATYSEKEDLLVINNNDYIEYQKLDFDDKEIILLIWKKIWRVQCWDKTDIICK